MKNKIKAIPVLILFVVIITSFKRITDHSMHPILQYGDFVLISPFVENIKYGDLIVMHDPLDKSTFLIRRIVGLSGDQISMNANGTLYINNHMLEQKELDHDITYRYIEEILHKENSQRQWRISKRLEVQIEEEMKNIIPSQKTFLLSDNRDDFIDSRIWGSIDNDEIKGRVILRIGAQDLWQNHISIY
jgi:signal peptidase I